ncbi:MAG: alpha/beta fold hydrolase [Rhizobacter sp.]|nr:alpha/beta fold hydrolase [Burkholderiales bacterium]
MNPFSSRVRIGLSILIATCSVAASQRLHAQDYEREKRWADEVVPNLVVGDAVRIKAASNREFLALFTEPSKPNAALPAIVLVHGVGVHPDFGVIGILRAKLADVGYATLAVQMPVNGKEATVDDYYPKLFPDAADRIAKAADFLRAKGFANVVLLSHSMGAWMANAYLDQAFATTPYKAWIVMGLTGSYSWPMRRFPMPILDIYGEQDISPVLSAVGRRNFALKEGNGSKQVKIAGADHHYLGRESELVTVIDAFLRALK